MDASALQHAATRLRKTEYGESLRSDESSVPNGGMERSFDSSSGRDWKNSQKFSSLGGNQTREEIPSSSSHSNEIGSFSNIHRHPNPLNNNNYPIENPSQNKQNVTYSSTALYSTPSKLYVPSSNSYSTITSSSSTLRSTSPRNESPWISEIDKTLDTSSVNSMYSTPSRINQNAPSVENPGLLYTTISKVSNTQPTVGIKTTKSSVEKRDGNDFLRELRDGGLTDRQKVANESRTTVRTVDPLPFDANRIVQEATRTNDEISQLVSNLRTGLNSSTSPRPSPSSLPSSPPPPPPSSSSYHETKTTSSSSSFNQRKTTDSSSLSSNVCVNCHEEITSSKPGCTALNQIFHVACFKCNKCGNELAGVSFYNVDGQPICEKDYIETLEKCSKCGKGISDRLLRAVGGAFHVHCFTCIVCDIALDGIPFTVDSENHVHCVPCFHEKFAPRCALCSKAIIPGEGEKESVRVVAMDKSFHVECYRCEDCGLQLSSKVEGQGCYPLDSHLYCKTCNGNRLRIMSSS